MEVGRSDTPCDLGWLCNYSFTHSLQRWLRTKELTDSYLPCPHAAVQFPCRVTRLFTHAVIQDATHLLFTAVAYSILQMHSANCGNNHQFLEIKNENHKNIRESNKREPFYEHKL